jgi:hypothetical protein
MEINKYFDLEELVCKHVLDRYGDFAWNFFDAHLLETLVILREHIDKSTYVNNYSIGGQFSQRGFRCVQCQLMQDVYKSGKLFTDPHALGKAIDADITGMTAEQVRQWIIANQSIFPYPIRLESGVQWLHIDVMTNSSQKVTLFNA